MENICSFELNILFIYEKTLFFPKSYSVYDETTELEKRVVIPLLPAGEISKIIFHISVSLVIDQRNFSYNCCLKLDSRKRKTYKQTKHMYHGFMTNLCCQVIADCKYFELE